MTRGGNRDIYYIRSIKRDIMRMFMINADARVRRGKDARKRDARDMISPERAQTYAKEVREREERSANDERYERVIKRQKTRSTRGGKRENADEKTRRDSMKEERRGEMIL
jgi:hypothetical protein